MLIRLFFIDILLYFMYIIIMKIITAEMDYVNRKPYIMQCFILSFHREGWSLVWIKK